MNRNALFIPDACLPGQSVSLIEPVSSIQLVTDEKGRVTLGKLFDLPVRTTLELCGDGFDERTVKVRVSGQCYFIFLDDLEPRCGMLSLIPAMSYCAG